MRQSAGQQSSGEVDLEVDGRGVCNFHYIDDKGKDKGTNMSTCIERHWNDRVTHFVLRVLVVFF